MSDRRRRRPNWLFFNPSSGGDIPSDVLYADDGITPLLMDDGSDYLTQSNFASYILGLASASAITVADTAYILQAAAAKYDLVKYILSTRFVSRTDSDSNNLVLDSSHAFKTIVINQSGANTITIPSNTLIAEDLIRVIRIGAGQTTIVAGDGSVTIEKSLSGGSVVDAGQNIMFSIRFYTANDVYVSNGQIVAPSYGDVVAALGYTPFNEVLAWKRVDLTGGSDITLSSTSFADITGLLFPITSGVRREFRATIFFNSSTSTEGMALAINGPTLTATRYKFTAGTNASTQQERVSVAYNSMTVTTAGSQTLGIAFIENGRVLTSANGNIQLRGACETGGSNTITVLRGSYIEYRDAGY